MIVDLLRFLAPHPAVVLEQTDHLTLLAVHADDGLLGPLEPVARALDGQELTVSSGAVPRFMLNAGFDILAIGLEREAHLVQQARHRIGTDLDTEAEQLLGNLLGGLAGPAQAAHRIAGDLVAQQLFYAGDDLRSFFSADGRPPPRLRTPSASMSHSSSSRRPLATVCGSTPNSWAMRASPPWPIFRDSRPAKNRRCRSSSRLKNRMIAVFNSCANTPAVTRSNSPATIWRRATLWR